MSDELLPWPLSAENKVLPNPESCRLIDFETVEVVPGIINGTWFVTVSGTKPWLNMKVELVPLLYVRQPEYWGIEVVGCLAGNGLPALAPYDVFLALAGVTGTKGIEIIGATSSEKREVPPT